MNNFFKPVKKLFLFFMITIAISSPIFFFTDIIFGIFFLVIANTAFYINLFCKQEDYFGINLSCKCCTTNYSSFYNYCPNCGTKKYDPSSNDLFTTPKNMEEPENLSYPEEENIDLGELDYDVSVNDEIPDDITNDLPNNNCDFSANDFS